MATTRPAPIIVNRATNGFSFDEIREAHLRARRCTRCVLDERTPGLSFGPDGVCSYCRLHDQLEQEFPVGEPGTRRLERIVAEIKRAGRNKPFDVIIGVSGGCDSSFLVTKAVEMGLRPLAVHFDNTWNSATATRNIECVLSKLNVELFTYVVDNEEYNDICRAFIRSGVIDIDTPTDIGLATTLYMAAAKYGISYQMDGNSFRTEGVAPIGWFYMDGRYIEDVVRKHGQYRQHRLRSFPNLTFARFMKFMLVDRVHKLSPIYHLDYDKEAAKKMLNERFGWKWYGGHHLENRFTAFLHSYYAPRRFHLDTRPLGHSALVRSGQLSRERALEMLLEPFHVEDGLVDLVKKRLGFSNDEFERILSEPTRTYRDFQTYKRLFERLRPFFWAMMKLDLVPKRFYIKYTVPSPSPAPNAPAGGA